MRAPRLRARRRTGSRATRRGVAAQALGLVCSIAPPSVVTTSAVFRKVAGERSVTTRAVSLLDDAVYKQQPCPLNCGRASVRSCSTLISVTRSAVWSGQGRVRWCAYVANQTIVLDWANHDGTSSVNRRR